MTALIARLLLGLHESRKLRQMRKEARYAP